MTHGVTSLDYREIGAEQLEVIRPLWEKLNAYHVQLSLHFAVRRSECTFDERKQELLAKTASGRLKVDVTYADPNSAPVAYCVTSLASDGTGEIDSLFVEQDYRGSGIGTALMRCALAWLDGHNAVSKVVTVAFGNDSAIEFYRQFGLLADNIFLRQISDTGCQPGDASNGSQPIRAETKRPSSTAGSRR
jgi:ribosomal protein S18 acetylase RimI-like enzyme